MGSTGVILQKRDNVDLKKAIEDIKVAAGRANLKIILSGRIEKCEFEGNFSTIVNLANKFDNSDDEQQLLLYVYSQGEKDYLDEFDWIRKDGHLIQSINIEDISGCEEILLSFLYEYMSINPDVVFWDEYQWAYSYSDVVRIKNKEFDELWCYKNPQ